MKRIFFFFIVLIIGCKSPKITSSETVSAKETSKSSEKRIYSDASSVGAIMNFLASDDLQGREAGSEGILEAANYIERVLKANAVKPYFVSYKDTLSNFKKGAFNVVGVLEGSDPVLKNEFIVIGAHYDHIGRGEGVNGDFIANGANDNASGTTAVLEMVNYFGKTKTNKRSILFALFSAEEKGLLGSKHLAKKLKAQNFNLYAMVNFEMIGVPMTDKDYTAYVTGYKKSNMADEFNRYAGKKLIGFLPTAEGYQLFQRSDNYPFHKEFEVPSQTICTFDFTNFDHYHKVGDENEIMNFEHMASVINEMIAVLEKMSAEKTQTITYK